jgi:thioredoxin 1
MEKIMFFSAPWCGPCTQVKMMLSENIKEELNIEIIDISEDMELATKYQVMNVPTFVKVKDDIEVSRHIGTTTIESLKRL